MTEVKISKVENWVKWTMKLRTGFLGFGNFHTLLGRTGAVYDVFVQIKDRTFGHVGILYKIGPGKRALGIGIYTLLGRTWEQGVGR